MVAVYAKQMLALQAREQLDRIEAASVPNMKPESARDVLGRLFDRLNVKREKPVRPTVEQLAAIGIKAQQVKEDGDQ